MIHIFVNENYNKDLIKNLLEYINETRGEILMIKIFIGKRDYKNTLEAVLRFINDKSERELTYSVDNAMVDADVHVYVTKLFNSRYIREHSGELPEDIFVHIADGLGIYVNDKLVSIDVLEDYIKEMQ